MKCKESERMVMTDGGRISDMVWIAERMEDKELGQVIAHWLAQTWKNSNQADWRSKGR